MFNLLWISVFRPYTKKEARRKRQQPTTNNQPRKRNATAEVCKFKKKRVYA